VCLALLLSPLHGASAAPRASSKDERQAVALTKRASVLTNLGKYPEAIELFLQALRLSPGLAGAWRNLGLAYEAQKEWALAVASYERYLGIAGTTGRYSIQVMARVNECRKHLGQSTKVWSVLGAPGKIHLDVSHPGATIRINGLSRGSSPVGPLPVNAGAHQIEVTLLGHLPFVRSVAVKEGQTVKVRVDLQKDPAYVPPRRVEGIRHKTVADVAYLKVDSPAEGLSVRANGRALAQNAELWYVVPHPGPMVVEVWAPGRVTWRRRVELVKGERKTLFPLLPLAREKRRYEVWGWTSLGLAALAASVGGIFSALENKTYEDVRDRRAYTREALENMAAEGRLYRNVAIGLYAAAGAALTASITLFVLERRGEAPTGRPLPIVLGPTKRGAGLTLSLSGEVDF
jgi:tetratricopeptide (TPR) repeat protein